MANNCYYYGYVVTENPAVESIISTILDGKDPFRFASHIWDCSINGVEQDGMGHFRIWFDGECAWTAHHLHEGDLDGETCITDGFEKRCVSLKSLGEELGFGYYLYWEEFGCDVCCEAARDNRGDEIFYRDLMVQMPEDWYDEDKNPDCESFEFETEEPTNERLFKEVQ